MPTRTIVNANALFSCYTPDKTWVNNPLEAQRMAEKVTRSTIGVRCCPVPGIPAPEKEEEEELTHELNLQ